METKDTTFLRVQNSKIVNDRGEWVIPVFAEQFRGMTETEID